MKMKMKAFIPHDPVTGSYYINAVGNNENEAKVNLDLCEDSYEVVDRCIIIPCEIHVD